MVKGANGLRLASCLMDRITANGNMAIWRMNAWHGMRMAGIWEGRWGHRAGGWWGGSFAP